MDSHNRLTTFFGGPCDGLSTQPETYHGQAMVVMPGPFALHLYERVSEHRFEHWATFPDDEDEQESWRG